MLIIGLTGPTGAGKTTALEVLGELGFTVVDCDALYDELLRWDESLKQELRGAFGDSFFQDGKLNKKALGKLVFADQKAMARLNGIVFSAVGTAVEEIIEKTPREVW